MESRSQASSLILLRDLAARGVLATADLAPEEASVVRSAAYHLAWPLVFNGHTRSLERRKRHPACVASLTGLAPECLDGFHNDVEAVVDYLFRHAKRPIHNLEGWITSRITMATIDAHRRRRGARGAQQKPRVPSWLAAALNRDPWLVTLAENILEWAGTTTVAGLEVWPLDTWAELRRSHRSDWNGSELAVVAGEVTHVLDVMRNTRPVWYATYVEQPLGRKQPPVAPTAWRDGADSPPPLLLASRDDRDDADLAQIASLAVQSLAAELAPGVEPRGVVVRVIRTFFLGPEAAGRDLDLTPHAYTTARDELLATELADDFAVDRIVEAVLEILSRPGSVGADSHR